MINISGINDMSCYLFYKIAFACKNGSIIICKLKHPLSLVTKYTTSINKSEVISIDWLDRNLLVSLYNDSYIRIWKFKETQECLQDFSIGSKEEISLVKCLSVNEIVVGFKNGSIEIWDKINGVQIEKFHTHSAPILDICISKDKKCFYATGTDPKIVSFCKCVNKSNEEAWQITSSIKGQSNGLLL